MTGLTALTNSNGLYSFILKPLLQDLQQLVFFRNTASITGSTTDCTMLPASQDLQQISLCSFTMQPSSHDLQQIVFFHSKVSIT